MQSQCVQHVIAGHILILITDHIEVTSPGSFKMWAIFNRWAHCDYFVSVNTMSSQCTCWVFDPLSPVIRAPTADWNALTVLTRPVWSSSLAKIDLVGKGVRARRWPLSLWTNLARIRFTGGEGAWKPVITCWVHLELMCIFPTM